MVGGAMITLMNNADRVKTACLAQLVNIIGPIMTEPGGPAWRQTIFHPFATAAQFGRGDVLRATVQTDAYATDMHPKLDYLLASVVHEEESGIATIFALNRSAHDEMDLTVELRGLGNRQLVSATELHHERFEGDKYKDRAGTCSNLRSNPRVSLREGRVEATLAKPLSWNVIVTDLS